MEYYVEADVYTCRNGKKLGVDHIRHSKSKTGYESEKTIYKCEDCNGCFLQKRMHQREQLQNTCGRTGTHLFSIKSA